MEGSPGVRLWGQERLLARGCQNPRVLILQQCGLWELGPTYTWLQKEAEGGWAAHGPVIGLEVEPYSLEPGVAGGPQELEERGWMGVLAAFSVASLGIFLSCRWKPAAPPGAAPWEA